MMKWLHHLFNPHCIECQAEYERKSVCKSCEILERQLELEREHVEILLNRIANPVTQTVTTSEEPVELKPLPRSGRRFVPFAVREQLVRDNDEKTLEVLKENNKLYNDSLRIATTPPETPIIDNPTSTDALEKELLESNVLVGSK